MEKLIKLKSDEGQKLLQDVLENDWECQPGIIEIFGSQVGRAACGIRSFSMIISGILRAQKQSENGSSASRSSSVQLGVAENETVVSERAIIEFLVNRGWTKANRYEAGGEGMTLDELGVVLPMIACTAVINHAADCTVDNFKTNARKALSSTNSGVLINYHMNTLGQNFDCGHISPVAAYHHGTDRFLLLDTWPESSVVWAKTEALFKAMNTIDDSVDATRGYAIINVDSVNCAKIFGAVA